MSSYPANTGHMASLAESEKKKRLDAMVKIWQGDTERRLEREGYRAFTTALALDSCEKHGQIRTNLLIQLLALTYARLRNSRLGGRLHYGQPIT